MSNLYIKKFQFLLPVLLFLFSIQVFSRNISDNQPEKYPGHDAQEISIVFDAFEIYNNFNNIVYSLGFIDEAESKSSAIYSIVAGNRKGIWEVDNATGKLLLKDPDVLNNTEEFQYRILIELKDRLSQHTISHKKITITVQINNITDYFEINGNSENVTEKVLLEEKTFNTLYQ